MRILHVVPSLLQRGGGPSESVPMTAMAQLRAGAEVAIAYRDCGPLSAKAQEAAAAGVRLMPYPSRIAWWNPLGLNVRFWRELEREAAAYDLVITHVNWLFFVWWAAHVARKLGKPYVMMPRGSFAPERLKLSAWKKRLVGWIDRHYARHATAVWTTSESEAEGVRKYVPGARTAVFPIGLDCERFRGFEVPKFRGFGVSGDRTLLFFSRISPIKGLDLLAEAWGRVCREMKVRGVIERSEIAEGLRVRRWNLLIAGPDDRGYAEEIKKVFAAKCPAGNYEFRGPVYGEEKLKLLASADAFILPTLNENWGIAVAEAMASGLPVICTKGAPWECLERVNAGRWVDVSVEGIRKGIEDVLSLSDEERHAMGERGRRWVQENLDWTAIAKKMIEWLKG